MLEPRKQEVKQQKFDYKKIEAMMKKYLQEQKPARPPPQPQQPSVFHMNMVQNQNQLMNQMVTDMKGMKEMRQREMNPQGPNPFYALQQLEQKLNDVDKYKNLVHTMHQKADQMNQAARDSALARIRAA